MRHRHAGRHLGRDTAHRMSMYRNLVTDLLRYERITTTEARAKEIRPLAEKIITLGRRGDLHARRQALRFVYDPTVVAHVFDEVAPRMADRPGGYLRITKLEPRKGDGARMATIELVDYVEAPPTPRPQRVTAAPTRAAAAAARAAVEDEHQDEGDLEEDESPEATLEDGESIEDDESAGEGEAGGGPDEPSAELEAGPAAPAEDEEKE
jgi:large subunit ribosomal protein L17